MQQWNPNAHQQIDQPPILAQQQIQQVQELGRHRRQRGWQQSRGPFPALRPQLQPARLRVVSAGLGAAAILLWLVVIATHVEWVRRHDGPITPISFSVPVVLSILAAGFLLVLCLMKIRSLPATGRTKSSVSIQQPDYRSDSDRGARTQTQPAPSQPEPVPFQPEPAPAQPEPRPPEPVPQAEANAAFATAHLDASRSDVSGAAAAQPVRFYTPEGGTDAN